jgi:NAD(P)-dependent dehydrogenase (short-subunit alcohol dehydrogenase family)
MSASLVWISGASGGIGQALAKTVPWDGARVIGISRHRPGGTIDHLKADLADPSMWPVVGDSFHREMEGFDGEHVVFVHAAGTIDPTGFAAEVDSDAYLRNVLLNSAAPQVLGQLSWLPPTRSMLIATSSCLRQAPPGASIRDGRRMERARPLGRTAQAENTCDRG